MAPDALGGSRRPMKPLPALMSESFNRDPRSAMACHQALATRRKLDVRFADRYARWQRGSNENASGLLRGLPPRGSDITEVATPHPDDIARLRNGRPRKRWPEIRQMKRWPMNAPRLQNLLRLILETKLLPRPAGTADAHRWWPASRTFRSGAAAHGVILAHHERQSVQQHFKIRSRKRRVGDVDHLCLPTRIDGEHRRLGK